MIKLISVNASPFVRKATVLIIELGLQDKVELVNPGPVSPVSNNESLNSVNPLGMIPALELENGEGLYDSRVICEYLNDIGGGSLYPTETNARFKALQLQALADGFMDVAVALRYELATRPEALRWDSFIDHQGQKMDRALAQLEVLSKDFNQEPKIGEFTAACALGYCDFRFPEKDWRAAHPTLATWFEGIMQRESLASTMPS